MRRTPLRRILLTALPKVLLSRLCGGLCSLPLPRWFRPRLYGWFARRYGASLDEIQGSLADFVSLQQFFRRPLREGARPVASTALVWPCDGRIITAGRVENQRIAQVKGHDYSLADLLGDAELARSLEGGSQVTIYLAPGDYHRVHAPFGAEIERVTAIAGTLFPVNPPAVECIHNLFVRNSRHVFRCRLASGLPAAVVMVGAYNVGGTLVTRPRGPVRAGDEIGQFGFGSTVVAIVARGPLTFAEPAREQRVRMGGTAT
jgi:phosphatidylserine decarboxylase